MEAGKRRSRRQRQARAIEEDKGAQNGKQEEEHMGEGWGGVEEGRPKTEQRELSARHSQAHAHPHSSHVSEFTFEHPMRQALLFLWRTLRS